MSDFPKWVQRHPDLGPIFVADAAEEKAANAQSKKYEKSLNGADAAEEPVDAPAE